MGTRITRMRGDRKYLYYAYYDSGTRKEFYCGPASEVKSDMKALGFEMDELAKQRKMINERLNVIKKRIG